MCICLFALVLLCDFHNKFHLLINWLSYQFFHWFVEDLVVYKDISILHALYVCIWYVFNKLSSLNKYFIIIIIIIIIIIKTFGGSRHLIGTYRMYLLTFITNGFALIYVIISFCLTRFQDLFIPLSTKILNKRGLTIKYHFVIILIFMYFTIVQPPPPPNHPPTQSIIN